MIIIWSEWENECVALGIQHAKRMRHIVFCGLQPFYNILFLYYLKKAWFSMKQFAEHNFFWRSADSASQYIYLSI